MHKCIKCNIYYIIVSDSKFLLVKPMSTQICFLLVTIFYVKLLNLSRIYITIGIIYGFFW